jgi:hypothetical protein
MGILSGSKWKAFIRWIYYLEYSFARQSRDDMKESYRELKKWGTWLLKLKLNSPNLRY